MGVSEAKLVAIIDRQIAHHGIDRPPRKNASESLEAFREKKTPTAIANTM